MKGFKNIGVQNSDYSGKWTLLWRSKLTFSKYIMIAPIQTITKYIAGCLRPMDSDKDFNILMFSYVSLWATSWLQTLREYI